MEPYLTAFVRGLELTLIISAISVVLSLIIGLGVCLLRRSRFRGVRYPAIAYTEFFRNVPLLVTVYLVFYQLPELGLLFSPVVAGVIALTLNNSAYLVEVFRGGFNGVNPGQYEAAYVLGIGRVRAFAHVILPQLIRITLPTVGNQVILVVLGSSLASVVGVPELLNVGYRVGSETFRYFESFVIAAVMYVVAVQVIGQLWHAGASRVVGSPVDARERGLRHV